MRTAKEKEIVKQEEGQVVNEFTLTEAFALWKRKAKSGLDYFTGRTADKKTNLVAYFNSTKKNPKEPDIRIYSVDSEGKQDLEVASLWENVSKTEKRYLTGSTNDNEKLVGWYAKEENEKRPYIRVYYK